MPKTVFKNKKKATIKKPKSFLVEYIEETGDISSSKLKQFKKDLIKRGYTKYGSSVFYSELYQKCIEDKKGKKYFIDFKQKAVPVESGAGCFFKLDCQFDTKIGNKKVTVDISSNQWFNSEEKQYEYIFFPDLVEIERFVENLWRYLGSNYYERYNLDKK